VGVLVGAHAVEGDAQRLDLGLKHVGHREHWIVPAGTHLERQCDQRIDIAEGAKGGENNPHRVWLGLTYDGSLWLQSRKGH